MVRVGKKQMFNAAVKKFTSESQLAKEKQHFCTNIVKSNFSNCTICGKKQTHKMRIQYAQCSMKDCPNMTKPCFKIMSCPLNKRYSLSTSKLHFHHSQSIEREDNFGFKPVKRLAHKRTNKTAFVQNDELRDMHQDISLCLDSQKRTPIFDIVSYACGLYARQASQQASTAWITNKIGKFNLEGLGNKIKIILGPKLNVILVK